MQALTQHANKVGGIQPGQAAVWGGGRLRRHQSDVGHHIRKVGDVKQCNY